MTIRSSTRGAFAGAGTVGDGTKAEGCEPDQECQEDRGLGFPGESAEPPCRDDDGLGREPAEETADGHEEEDAEGRER